MNAAFLHPAHHKAQLYALRATAPMKNQLMLGKTMKLWIMILLDMWESVNVFAWMILWKCFSEDYLEHFFKINK